MAGFEPACLLLPKQAGWPDSPTSRGAPGEIQTPVLLGRNQALLFAELRGRDTDGQSRTDTVQGLSLVPLPVGLRRREGGVGGSRTLASDRAKIAGWPAAQPHEPTEKESNLRLPGFNRTLVPSQLSVDLEASAGVEPASAALQAAGWAALLSGQMDRGEGFEPSLPRSERDRLPVSGSPNDIVCGARRCAPFAFHSSGYLPAVSPSVPAGMSLPTRAGDHRSPPRGSRPRTDCSTVRVLPGSTWVSRIAPERIRTSPVPPGGRARPAQQKGRPLGRPRLVTCGSWLHQSDDHT